MKLTQPSLLALTCPQGKKDRLVSDDDQVGHYVRVLGTARAGSLNGKTYFTQFTFAGKKERIPHGPCSGVTLSQSRLLTQGFLGDVARGINPKAERSRADAEARRQEAKIALTLGRLIDDWRDLHLANRRPRYAEEAVRAVRHALAEHLSSPAAKIDRALAVTVIDGVAKGSGQTAARNAVAYAKALWGWAVARGMLESNPFANLPVARSVQRERVLSDAEIAAVWRATHGPGRFNSIVRVLLLTGQRRDEVGGMGWSIFCTI